MPPVDLVLLLKIAVAVVVLTDQLGARGVPERERLKASSWGCVQFATCVGNGGERGEWGGVWVGGSRDDGVRYESVDESGEDVLLEAALILGDGGQRRREGLRNKRVGRGGNCRNDEGAMREQLEMGPALPGEAYAHKNKAN